MDKYRQEKLLWRIMKGVVFVSKFYISLRKIRWNNPSNHTTIQISIKMSPYEKFLILIVRIMFYRLRYATLSYTFLMKGSDFVIKTTYDRKVSFTLHNFLIYWSHLHEISLTHAQSIYPFHFPSTHFISSMV